MSENFEVIYLQSKENSEAEGRLWCQDKIYDDDTKYIRADLAKRTFTQKDIQKVAEALMSDFEIEGDGYTFADAAKAALGAVGKVEE